MSGEVAGLDLAPKESWRARVDEMDVGNLVSGLVGALLGVVGAFVIQWRETRKDQAAAARVVFMEAAANSAALGIAKETGVYVPLATSAWTAEQGRLARALSPGDLARIATFYMRLDLIRGRGFTPGGTPDPALRVVATEAWGRCDLATDILEKRGWWPWQRAAMHQAIREFLVE
jgi:hypothetical protein